MIGADLMRDLGQALDDLIEALVLWACEEMERLLEAVVGPAEPAV